MASSGQWNPIDARDPVIRASQLNNIAAKAREAAQGSGRSGLSDLSGLHTRRDELLPDVAWWEIISNDGAGLYTVRRLKWEEGLTPPGWSKHPNSPDLPAYEVTADATLNAEDVCLGVVDSTFEGEEVVLLQKDKEGTSGTDKYVAVDSGDAPDYLENQVDDDGVWISVAKDTGKMKTSHIGPGPTCWVMSGYGCGALTILGMDVDEKGHIRWVQVCGDACWSDGDCVGPCGCMA